MAFVPENDPSFLEGVQLFNDRKFWHAHESWETIWLGAGDRDVREFLQALIQIAAAYHHLQRGTLRGAVRLFDAALNRLETLPPALSDVTSEAFVATCRRHRAWAHSLVSTATEGNAWSERVSESDLPTISLNRNQT